MTLKKAKEKALALLGVTPTSPAGLRYLTNMNLFFDMAQLEVIRAVPIVRYMRLDVRGGIGHMPMGAITAIALTDGQKSVPFTQIDGGILADDGSYMLEYTALPNEITNSSPDESVFEVSEALASALPFYAAALCVVGEDESLYRTLMGHYNARVEGAVTVKARVVI